MHQISAYATHARAGPFCVRALPEHLLQLNDEINSALAAYEELRRTGRATPASSQTTAQIRTVQPAPASASRSPSVTATPPLPYAVCSDWAPMGKVEAD